MKNNLTHFCCRHALMLLLCLFAGVEGSLIELALAALGGNSYEDEKYVYTFAGLENAALTDVITESTTYYVLYTKEEKVHTATENAQQVVSAQKIIRDDHVLIIRNGKMYTVQGQETK